MKQPVLPAQLEEVARKYRIKDPKVESFLLWHPEIVQLLLEARPHIQRHFGKDTIVNLQFPHYDENGNDGDLFAVILTHLDPHSAVAVENKFWNEWWIAASGRQEATLF